MKYSVIIPTLNEEKLLPELLRQLSDDDLNRKYDFEIIVSDGGSRDKTVSIALEYADKVKVHNNSAAQNIAGGRNSGAKYAKGEIFVFINGDVIFENVSGFFGFLEKNFAANKFLAMTCKVKIFPHEETLLDRLFHYGYNSYFRLLNGMGLGMGRGECQVVKRNIFFKVGGYNEALAAGEDFDLFRRVRRLGKILYTKEICVFESPRRFRKLGYKGVTVSWVKNGFSVLFKNKSLSKEWEQVR